MQDRIEPITDVDVVTNSESSTDNVLGVFADAEEMKAYTDRVRNDYEGGVFSTLFPLGIKGTDPETRYLD